jgi:hypothetical protein
MKAYKTVHGLLTQKRGSAKGYACISCGKPAHEWSYSNSDPLASVQEIWTRGRMTRLVYSEDLSSYEPLCRPCHRKRDSTYLDYCRELLWLL